LTKTLNYGELVDSHDKDCELAVVNAGVDGGEDTKKLFQRVLLEQKFLQCR